MATIDDKDFIDRLIANDGRYEDDPQILEICSYRTVEGKLTWSVAWTGADRANLRTSPFVRDIEVIWQRKHEQKPCVECGLMASILPKSPWVCQVDNSEKITPRRVRVKCENCGEFNTTQRYEPMGCPQCGFPVQIVKILPDKV